MRTCSRDSPIGAVPPAPTLLTKRDWALTPNNPLPLISSRLAQELGRRAFLDISADRVTGIAMLLELAHIAARRLLG